MPPYSYGHWLSLEVSHVYFLLDITPLTPSLWSRMRDWVKRQAGCHKRLWCSQDSIHKSKSQTGKAPGAKTRDTLGMDRYPCDGHLDILTTPLPVDPNMWETPCHTIQIILQHDLFEQEMCRFKQVLLELSDILEYNAPLTDLRTLPVLRHHLAAVSDLHARLLEKEKITNSVTDRPPRTWDTQSGDIMFFRTRPPKRIHEFSQRNAF